MALLLQKESNCFNTSHCTVSNDLNFTQDQTGMGWLHFSSCSFLSQILGRILCDGAVGNQTRFLDPEQNDDDSFSKMERNHMTIASRCTHFTGTSCIALLAAAVHSEAKKVQHSHFEMFNNQ